MRENTDINVYVSKRMLIEWKHNCPLTEKLTSKGKKSKNKNSSSIAQKSNLNI